MLASEDRPLKRQKSCVAHWPQDAAPSRQGDVGLGRVLSLETRVSAEAIPSDTPAPFLAPTGLPLTSNIGGLRTASEATASRQIGTSLLHSLQRRFLHQQTLETPINSPGGGKDSGDQEEEDLEGFVLFSQPTYERVLSQRAPDGETTPPGPLCSALTVTTMDNIVGPSKVDSTEAPECAHEPDDAGTAGAAQAGLTPAVHSADRVQLNSGGPSGMFPIFRSRKDCKTLYIIRHGESEYNAACAAMGSRWEDPTIFDAPLTLRGKRQATALREHIAKWNLPSNVVWVTSPLSRAIETLLLALAVEKDQHKTQCDMAHRIHVLPDITERLVTSGDIGRSPKDLSRLFPVLEEQLLGLPEVWWYDHPTRRNCSNLRTFRSSEPKEELQKRIKAFRKWLLARSEKVFVAVGHSVFWKAFATACKNGTKQDALRNCGYMVLHV